METILTDLPAAERQYPSISDRVQSTFIDSLLIVALMFVCSSWLDKYENAPEWIRIALFVGLWGIYEPVCTTLGCTVGNYLKNIRVRRHGDTARRINLLQAFIRYVLKVLLGWISFVSVHANRDKRAIHDYAAQSVMIRKP